MTFVIVKLQINPFEMRNTFQIILSHFMVLTRVRKEEGSTLEVIYDTSKRRSLKGGGGEENEKIFQKITALIAGKLVASWQLTNL